MKKVCSRCGIEKSLNEFHKRKEIKSGHISHCKSCKEIYRKQYVLNNKAKINIKQKTYNIKNREKKLLYSNQYYRDHKDEFFQSEIFHKKKTLKAAKERAKKYNIPFHISLNDIPLVPDICPILNIKIFRSRRCVSPNSPSLDRIRPELGYVVNNIQWISQLANQMKNAGSFDDMIKLGKWAQNQLDSIKYEEDDHLW